MPKKTPAAYAALLNEMKVDVSARRKREEASKKVLTGPVVAALLRAVNDALKISYPEGAPPVWGSINGSCVSFGVNLHNLDGLKDRRLERVLEAPMSMDSPEWSVSNSDYPASLNRDYYFSTRVQVGDETVQIALSVCAYVRSDSPTCRKVVVGQNTVVTPVYKIECS